MVQRRKLHDFGGARPPPAVTSTRNYGWQ